MKLLKEFNWQKKYGGKFYFIVNCYNAYFDVISNKKEYGLGFKRILFTQEKNIVSYYRVKKESEEFGQFLVGNFSKNERLNGSNKLKLYSDKVRKFIKEPIEKFKDKISFEKFEKLLENFHIALMAVFASADFSEKEILNVYQEARLYSESVYDEVNDFFYKLSHYLFSDDILLLMTIDEFKNYLDSNILIKRNILDKRNLCTYYFDSEGQKIFFEKFKFNYSERGILQGMGVSKGKVKGKVKIILNSDNINEFNDGEILVTLMTRPEFIPILKKSLAIVTDAGGMLCHAAITSREFNIPCVVGTEFATKVFKDGDYIEVDADNGVVRKV